MFFSDEILIYDDLQQLIHKKSEQARFRFFMTLGPILDFNVYNRTLYLLRIDGKIFVHDYNSFQYYANCNFCTKLPFLLYKNNQWKEVDIIIYSWEIIVAEFLSSLLLFVFGVICWHYRKLFLSVIQTLRLPVDVKKIRRDRRQKASSTPPVTQPLFKREIEMCCPS
jgi:hypothetical protein